MSWEVGTIGEVCTLEKGNIGITKAIDGEYPLVVLGEERRTHNDYQFDDEAVIIPLVSSTGHGHRSMKRIHYQTGKFSAGSILCAVIPKDKSKLSAQYLYRYLDLNKEKELVSRMKGMANVSLPMKSIAEVEIPIPPIEVQHNIVTRFDALEESNNTLFEEQSRQLDLLKKLRQQILQDAVQGKLVPQDPNDEPASKLLERIKTEKERLIHEKKIKKGNPLPEIKPEEIPFEIPENWVWCRLEEIISILGDGLHGTPVFSETGEYYFVNGNNLEDGVIEIKTNTKRASEEEYQKYKKEMHQNTVLVSINGTLGRLGYYNNEKIILGKSACYFNLLNELNKFYIGKFIKSPYFLKYAVDVASETTIKNVSLKSMRNLPISLPPFNEQDKIITKVEQLMTLCDELEQTIKQNQKYTQDLLQVALKEALEPKIHV